MKKIALSAWLLTAVTTAMAAGRDYISIVGSSTVYPFATVVAERFGKSSDFKTPKIESTGTGGGMKLFCKGLGVDTPDITNASRRIKSGEYTMCQENGVTDIIEVLIGYDGIVIANDINAVEFELSRKDIFLALAKQVPGKNPGELIDNPYTNWSEVNPALPNSKIEVLGPPPTSGTRDAFVELAMEGGCKKFDWIAELKSSDKDRYKSVCHAIREDGAYIEAGENDNLIVQKLQKNPNALGIFGFSFLDQNADLVKGSQVDGALPEFESIASGEYPVSRPLYFYVKKAHMDTIPGITEFLHEFVSENAMGEEGYLTDKGLIPLDADKFSGVQATVHGMKRLEL